MNYGGRKHVFCGNYMATLRMMVQESNKCAQNIDNLLHFCLHSMDCPKEVMKNTEHPLWSAKRSIHRASHFVEQLGGLDQCTKLDVCPTKNFLMYISCWVAEARDAAHACLLEDPTAYYCPYCRLEYIMMERVKELARLQHQHRHVYQERMHQEAMINNRNQQVFQAAQQLMTGVDHHRGRQDGYNTPVESQIFSYHVRQQWDQGAIQFQAQNSETAAFYDAGGNQLVRQETVQERMLEQRDRRISQREYDSSCFAFENFLNILEEEYKQTKDFFLLRRINQLVLSDSHGRDQQNQRALHSIFNRQMSSISSRSAPELNMIYEEQEEMMVEESVRPNGMNGQGGSGQFQNYLNNGYQGNMRR